MRVTFLFSLEGREYTSCPRMMVPSSAWMLTSSFFGITNSPSWHIAEKENSKQQQKRFKKYFFMAILLKKCLLFFTGFQQSRPPQCRQAWMTIKNISGGKRFLG